MLLHGHGDHWRLIIRAVASNQVIFLTVFYQKNYFLKIKTAKKITNVSKKIIFLKNYKQKN